MVKIKKMFGGKAKISLDTLKELILDNQIKDFDPVSEAFKVSLNLFWKKIELNHTMNNVYIKFSPSHKQPQLILIE